MKRLIALIIFALIGFYAVWPAWTGYRIASAIQSRDAALIESKIDFASVRASMRPTVETEVNKEIDKQAGQGLGAMLGGDLKRQIAPKLVDTVLEKVITGENVIRIAREGGNAAGTVQKILMEQMSKAGGIPGLPGGLPGMGGGGSSGAGGGAAAALGGILAGAGASGRLPGGLNIPGMGGGSAAPAPQAAPKPSAPAAAAPEGKASYGFSNIKSFGFSPLGYSLGIAKDPGAAKADATIKMRFTGFDWKITDVIPHLN